MTTAFLQALARYRRRTLLRYRRARHKRRTWNMPGDYRNPMSGLLALLIAIAFVLLVLRYWPVPS